MDFIRSKLTFLDYLEEWDDLLLQAQKVGGLKELFPRCVPWIRYGLLYSASSFVLQKLNLKIRLFLLWTTRKNFIQHLSLCSFHYQLNFSQIHSKVQYVMFLFGIYFVLSLVKNSCHPQHCLCVVCMLPDAQRHNTMFYLLYQCKYLMSCFKATSALLHNCLQMVHCIGSPITTASTTL